MAPKKSLLVSKTFWINILMAALAVAGSGVVPPIYAALITATVNIALRLISSGGVSIMGDPQ